MAKNKRITPREIVIEKFGSKEDLAKKLAGTLDRPEGVTEVDFVRRLKRQKNTKLMRLFEISESVESKYGSKEKLVDAIAERIGHATDKDYKAHLMSLNIARLYDLRRMKKKF